MKSVCLPETTWKEILDFLRTKGAEPRLQGLIQEQVDGSIKVRATRSGAMLKTKKADGRDLRDVVADMSK